MKQRLAAALALCLFASHAPNLAMAQAARGSCEHLYGHLTSEELDLIFVRKPGGAIDPVYRSNMLLVSEAFDRALHEGYPGEDFNKWLADQHVLAVLGENKGPFYWPEVNVRRDGRSIPANITTAKEAAGIYRHLRRDQSLTEFLTQEVKLEASTLQEITERTKERATRSVTVGPAISIPYHFPVVEQIPAEALPRYTLNKGTASVKYDYPPAGTVPLYVKEMEASFKRLRDGFASGSVNREAQLAELARYYHLAMVGHPFLRVNNSLAMAQINVALRRLGMKPVMHGDLDYVVRSLDSEGARKAFVDYVMRNQ